MKLSGQFLNCLDSFKTFNIHAKKFRMRKIFPESNASLRYASDDVIAHCGCHTKTASRWHCHWNFWIQSQCVSAFVFTGLTAQKLYVDGWLVGWFSDPTYSKCTCGANKDASSPETDTPFHTTFRGTLNRLNYLSIRSSEVLFKHHVMLRPHGSLSKHICGIYLSLFSFSIVQKTNSTLSCIWVQLWWRRCCFCSFLPVPS